MYNVTSSSCAFILQTDVCLHSETGRFVDGGLSHNNPSELSLLETKKIWPHTYLSCQHWHGSTEVSGTHHRHQTVFRGPKYGQQSPSRHESTDEKSWQ